MRAIVRPATPMSGLLEDLRTWLGGSYRVEREMGGGGMSGVLRAEEIALGRRVALKGAARRAGAHAQHPRLHTSLVSSILTLHIT